MTASHGLSSVISPWSQTTTGVVLMLLIVQFTSGVLLAFYYVPSIDHAYTTVSFIEKVVSSGSWIRSLHHYGSQWLPLFLFIHLITLRSAEAYVYKRVHWLCAVVLLMLVLSAGATGYSLPWDARAFFSTRVAEGLLAGLPFIGRNSRLWLLGGNEISTLTLSRFFALHVLVTPFLILCLVGWRAAWGLIKQQAGWCAGSVTRNVIAGGVVFLGLALWTLKFPAPLGPSVTEATSDYLPRPGGQFLWLYESLKHLPGGLGSLVGVGIPSLAFLVLLLLPWLDLAYLRKFSKRPQKLLASVILGVAAIWIFTMTLTSYLSDRRDPRIRQQLLKQEVEEQKFRQAPFQPKGLNTIAVSSKQAEPPAAYVSLCANCHGQHGEGARQGALKFPSLIGVGSKPRRTVDDIVGLLNDPAAYGLEPPMRSFATKLTDQEKREIAQWLATLK